MSYEELLACDADVVYLAIPSGPRNEYITKFIDAGKHIYTEKPVRWSLTPQAWVNSTRSMKL